MWGHRYFGAAYSGPHYWGPGVGAAPPVVVDTGTGGGPGWNLFQPGGRRPHDRSRDEIEADIASYLDQGADAGREEKREAVRELKAIVRETAGHPDFADVAAELDRIMRVQVRADVFMDKLRAIVARDRAVNAAQALDDEEAFLIIASLS